MEEKRSGIGSSIITPLCITSLTTTNPSTSYIISVLLKHHHAPPHLSPSSTTTSYHMLTQTPPHTTSPSITIIFFLCSRSPSPSATAISLPRSSLDTTSLPVFPPPWLMWASNYSLRRTGELHIRALST